MVLRGLILPVTALGALACGAASPADAESVSVYAAGSLRAVVTTLTATAATMGIEIKPTFGGSGTLRERIEKGDTPDLLLSADMASPIALAAEGRAIAPAVAFAHNRLCLVARRSLGLDARNIADRLLADGVRIKTSQPIADPSGDYAMALFDRIDRVRPGAGKTLRASAARTGALPAPTVPPGGTPTAALFTAGQIDVAVTYCSGAGDLMKSAADLDSVTVPAALDPKPVFGLALLSANPAAARFALLLLSQAGQSAIAQAGLLPLSDGQPLTP